MELYAQYRKEKDDAEVRWTEDDFIAFQIQPLWVHIGEIYVKPEKRKMGAGRLLESIAIAEARKRKIKQIRCYVQTGQDGMEQRQEILKKAGYYYQQTKEGHVAGSFGLQLWKKEI